MSKIKSKPAKQKGVSSFDINYILFGTHLNDMISEISLYPNSISFNVCGIDLKNVKKIMYCSDGEVPVLIVDIRDNSGVRSISGYIRQRIQLTEPSNGWFDVYSIDPSERYIIIEMSSNETIDELIECLSLQLSVNCKPIDAKKAHQLVSSARKMEAINFDINYILFGTHLTQLKRLYLKANKISFNDYDIDFKNIESIMYCTHPSLPVLIIKVNISLCRYINRKPIPDPSKGCFDVCSKDSSQRYIIIEFSSDQNIELFIKSFTHRLSKCDLQINCKSIVETKAKQLVTSARRLQTND